MTNCSEAGCNEEATHKFRSPAGFKILLCNRHYKEWEKYEYKRSRKMLLIGLGKWTIRATSILAIFLGLLITGMVAYTGIQRTGLQFDLNIGLIFFEIHLHQENPLNISAMGIGTLLAGFALFYIGFIKIEHDF